MPSALISTAAALHVVTSSLLFANYGMNRLPVDLIRFKDDMPALSNSKLSPSKFFKFTKYVIAYWATVRLSYYLAFLVFSFLGALRSNSFFAFHFFDLSLRISVMGFVVQAVRQNVFRIAAAILLLFILVYIFALIGQAGFPSEYDFISGSSVGCSSES